MNTVQKSSLRRWPLLVRVAVLLVMLALVVAPVARGQAPDNSLNMPDAQYVTEGRNVTLTVGAVTGATYQWQVLPNGGTAWEQVSDDATYHGSQTNTLEISGVTAAVRFKTYRVLRTLSGKVDPSSATTLFVNPLLFPNITGMALQGYDLLITDASTHTVRLVSQAKLAVWGNDVICGVITFAGRSGEAGDVDGWVPDGRLNRPNGIVVSPKDPNGVICDTANGLLRRMVGNQLTTFAGSTTMRGNIDGIGGAAQFGGPVGIAYSSDGNYYVADTPNHTIRKVTTSGVVTTLAGSPGNAGWADGTGSAARFSNPTGITSSADGTLYVTDTGNNLIRKVTPAGVVTTIAGIPGVAGSQDGASSSATFNGPTGIGMAPGISSAGAGYSFYVADTGNSTIRRVNLVDSKVTTFAGVPGVAGFRDGSGYYYFDALLDHPQVVIADDTGMVLIGDTGNAAIRGVSIYDGWLMTLPMRDDTSTVVVPPAQPTLPLPPPSTPASPSASNSTPASGGGGSPSVWFLVALTGLSLAARFRRHRFTNQPS